MPYVILNNELVSADKAFVSVEDRGFRFGDGVFETISLHEGVPYQFEWHIDRLQSGLSAIKIDYDTNNLKALCRKLLHANGHENGLLRIQITRGTGSRGYMPAGQNPTVVIETPPLPVLSARVGALWLSNYEKISPAALPVRYKLAQGMNQILARMDADDHHCMDALMLNAKGEICETSSGNIFWLKDGTLYTPALACGVLEGSTRAALLRLAPYPVREVAADIAELKQAEAAIICNAAFGCVAVAALEATHAVWNSHALAERLHALLLKDKEAYAQAHGQFWKMA